eukprot:660479-Alexandrium_andersonii.AAC.1
MQPTVFNPPHEALASEHADPDVLQQLSDNLASEAWPDSYWEHPVVHSSPPGQKVVPLCVYADG